MKKQRVLVLFDTDSDPPAGQDYTRQIESGVAEAEFDVARALLERGHAVRCLGYRNEIDAVVAGLRGEPFDVVFNLVEGFRGQSSLDYAVTSVLELFGLDYTGTPPFGLVVARDKALTKKILTFHGLRVPEFMVWPLGTELQRPSTLRFPLIVKPLGEDASVGIALTSVVNDDQALRERIAYLHEKLKGDVIVEEFIVGRELYVGVYGNDPPKALPPIEMVFENQPNEEARIASYKAKWSVKYRESKGIQNKTAKDLPKDVLERLQDAAVRTYLASGLRDYGRIDMRLAHDNEVYIVEANPNPYLARGEDLAQMAEADGFTYPEFIEKILEFAVARGRRRRREA